MANVGSGSYRYEVVENWGRLPAGWSFGRVTGVAVDSQQRVFVCQQAQDPPVLVFDQEGNYLNSWGSGSIGEPHTIYIGPDDIFYLADRGDHVAVKLTLDGKPLLELGNRRQPSDTGCTEDEGEVLRAGGPFNRPTRMTSSPSGDLYVSDGYRNSRVHRFSSDGVLVSSWGTPGTSAPSEIRSPHCVWVDKEGKVFVCDRLNNRIQIFSATGEFIDQWTDVELPTDLYIDANETFYIMERDKGEAADYWISVRDRKGNVLTRWDTPLAHQIWVDSNGDIFMAVPFEAMVIKYVKQG
jgi:DNA-binding beta-propeller fold protein YncE